MTQADDYEDWTREKLIQRLREVDASQAKPSETTETTLIAPPAATPLPNASAGTKANRKKRIDPFSYNTRYIALKLSYLGKDFGGFEQQPSSTKPTIESELWRALTKACLIFVKDPSVIDFESIEYSKCGRTDRGVSAFGQVIALRVRSNRPVPGRKRGKPAEDAEATMVDADGNSEAVAEEEKPWDPVEDEISYPRLLNRILPPEIRILAWCPSPPPEFSARFSCRERKYRYFFTQPAFSPAPSRLDPPPPDGLAGSLVKPGWLDIEAMQDAAKRFEGEHDFRNVCKIDPAKLISAFERTIFESSVEEVKDVGSLGLPYLARGEFTSGVGGTGPHPKLYSFNVRGSAFLWHQIRHMVALVFLVGQGLEKPSMIDAVLDVKKNPGRPGYNMADEVPLVLWDCVFPAAGGDPRGGDALDWVYVGDDRGSPKYGHYALMDGLWATWRERKIDEVLAGQLLKAVSEQGKYLPVVKRPALQPPDEQNDRYAKRKGFADADDMRKQKWLFRTARREADEAEE